MSFNPTEHIAWFARGAVLPFGGDPSALDLQTLEQFLRELITVDISSDLLPHIFEVFVSGPSGSSRHSDASKRNERSTKRQTGVFYTPADVASFLAKEAVSRWRTGRTTHDSRFPKSVDPACGTGVLLHAICECANSALQMTTADERLRFVTDFVFGFDLNPIALDAASFALLAWCLEIGELEAVTPLDAWGHIRKNLVCADSARFAERLIRCGANSQLNMSIHDRMDEHFHFEKHLKQLLPFDIVVANPPFSQSIRLDETTSVRKLSYAPFVRMLWCLTGPDGAGAIVLPLSIASSETRELRNLRSEMNLVSGEWHFSFYDRAPDSLFGDDVKTRATIALFRKSSLATQRIFTSRLHRWNSRTRAQLFDAVEYAELSSNNLTRSIPKLGSTLDVSLYANLRRRAVAFDDRRIDSLDLSELSALSSGERDLTLLVGPTAYNFVSVRPLQHTAADLEHVGSTWWGLRFPTIADKWAGFSLLSSRLTYWLWCVEGDGFHVNQRFVRNLPFELRDIQTHLAPHGEKLWRKMRHQPIRSVNKSRVTLSYSPIIASGDLDAIDEVLLSIAGSSDHFAAHIRNRQREMMLAGRARHDRLQHHLTAVSPEIANVDD